MEQDLILLNVAVLGAAALQSATGIGFGVIAGPILLIVINDGSAIQISIALNLLIAVILSPFLWTDVDRSILRNFVVGLAIGSPLGLLIYLVIDITVLKVTAGIGILLTLYFTLLGNRSRLQEQRQTASKSKQIPVGVIAGVMGVCLAMPGPIPAAWMSSRAFDKKTIRATILAMFVVSYSIAMGLQFVIVGFGAETLRLSLLLAPATFLGILTGHVFGNRIHAKTFRRILVGILASTVIILFSTLL